MIKNVEIDLLKAALFSKEDALRSWHLFLNESGLQNPAPAVMTLLPLVYRNLKEESHPFCKGVYRHTWAANQTLWKKTLPTLEQLIQAGIEKVILLKGMALILGHYRDFGVRTLGDIDILIDRIHVTKAYAILIDSGWKCLLRRFDPNNPHQLRRWHAANFAHPSGLNLDLHWSFLLESNDRLDREVLEAVAPGIHPAAPHHLFFQACIHGNKKSSAPLIRWIPDCLTLLKSPIDFPKLYQIANEAKLSLPFSSALAQLFHFNSSIPQFHPNPSRLEKLEYEANLRGQIYLAAFYRGRIRNVSPLRYLQHTASLSSAWLIFFYAPYWVLKRLFQSILIAMRASKT